MYTPHSPFLTVSATEAECAPVMRVIAGCRNLSPNLYSGTLNGHPVEILICGTGIMSTAFRLTQTLMQRSYRCAVSIGIAGSFANDIAIGETVQITEDCNADFGIDDNGEFRSFSEYGAVFDDFDSGFMINPFPVPSPHRKVRGITVQTVTGSRRRIDELYLRYRPHVETMENAAFFYVCRMMQIPFASFRAISNMVEPRNRNSWRIAEAIESVNESLKNYIR